MAISPAKKKMSGTKARPLRGVTAARATGASGFALSGPASAVKAVKRGSIVSVKRGPKAFGASKPVPGRVTNTDLFERTVGALGGEEQARAWLNAPNWALGGKTPLEFADTELGSREVENLLGRIEHGVFS